MSGLRKVLRPAKPVIARIEARLQLARLLLQQNLALVQTPDPWLRRAKNRHSGERCFVLGNGPSLNQIDISRLAGEVTFGVNGVYLLEGFTPTYYVTISATFWRHHMDEIRNVACSRRFLTTDMRELESDVPTSWMQSQRPVYASRFGVPLPVPLCFSRWPDRRVQTGGTVLFVCLQLAFHMGFSKAIILGVDHDYGPAQPAADKKWGRGTVLESSGETHFSGGYHSAGELFHVDLEAMERAYELSRDAFALSGRSLVNASPGTKLELIPKASFEALFETS